MMKDIEDRNDIELLVNAFYDDVKKDPLLARIFIPVIGDHWPEHLDKLYRFWETILLKRHTYNGAPFPPHMKLHLKAEHFERWLALFHQTVDRYFEGPVADEAKWRADRMAEMFLAKIRYFEEHR